MSVPTPITVSSQEDLSKFVSIITAAFSETALTTAFIVGADGTPPPYPSPLIDSTRRQQHFSQGILDSASSGAEVVQSGDWSAIALWEPPSYQGKTFIDSRDQPPEVLGEWRKRVKQARAKWLATPRIYTPNSAADEDSDAQSNGPSSDPDSAKLRPFYHLSFLARNPTKPTVPGSIRSVMEPFLKRCVEENVPAWLEATTSKAAEVYKYSGFRVVEEITIGKGKIDALGWPAKGQLAVGVTAYAMIYDEHLEC